MTDNSFSHRGIYRPLDPSLKEIRLLLFHFRVPEEASGSTQSATNDADILENLNQGNYCRCGCSSGDSSFKLPPILRDEVDDDEPLHLQLMTVSLLDQPEYVALSYTWGDTIEERWASVLRASEQMDQLFRPLDPRTQAAGQLRAQQMGKEHRSILLRGSRFNVRPNLYNFLCHLRKSFRMNDKELQATHCPRKQNLIKIVPAADCPWEVCRQAHGRAGMVAEAALWIDAVCINQEDVLERNQQVMLMGEVYRRASAVLSWLGADWSLVRGMQLAFALSGKWKECMREFAQWKEQSALQRSKMEEEHEEDPDSSSRSSSTPEQRNSTMLSLLAIEAMRQTRPLWHNTGELIALNGLFAANYFKRVWTLQEQILANPEEHIFMCGPMMVPVQVLDQVADFFWHLISADTDLLLTWNSSREGFLSEGANMDSLVWASMRHSLRRNLLAWHVSSAVQRGERALSLMFALQAATLGRRATDPRDLVYGLINLLPPDHGIEPDYRKPVRDVYIDWAIRTIRECGNLDLLVNAGTGYEGMTELDLPSWVPNLSDILKNPMIVFRNQDDNSNDPRREDPAWAFCLRPSNVAASDTGSDTLPFSIDVTQTGALKVRACRRATIQIIAQLHPNTGRQKWEFPGLHETIVRFCFNYLLGFQERRQKNEETVQTEYPYGTLSPLRALLQLFLSNSDKTNLTTPISPEPYKLVAMFIVWLLDHFWGFLGQEIGAWWDGVKEQSLWQEREDMQAMTELVPLLATAYVTKAILGLSFRDGFADSFRKIAFSEADSNAERALGWHNFLDLLDSLRQDTDYPVFHDRMRVLHRCHLRLMVTDDGHLASGTKTIEPGDEIYKVENCFELLAFRRLENSASGASNKTFTLRGHCQIVGIDRGSDGNLNEELEEIFIV